MFLEGSFRIMFLEFKGKILGKVSCKFWKVVREGEERNLFCLS